MATSKTAVPGIAYAHARRLNCAVDGLARKASHYALPMRSMREAIAIVHRTSNPTSRQESPDSSNGQDVVAQGLGIAASVLDATLRSHAKKPASAVFYMC